jgi:hypothetical protein
MILVVSIRRKHVLLPVISFLLLLLLGTVVVWWRSIDRQDLWYCASAGRFCYVFSEQSAITSGLLCESTIQAAPLSHESWPPVSTSQPGYSAYRGYSTLGTYRNSARASGGFALPGLRLTIAPAGIYDATGSDYSLKLSYWLLCTLLILIGVLFWLLAKDRHPRGFCPECGYDLRASHDRCPECGTRISSKLRPMEPPAP